VDTVERCTSCVMPKSSGFAFDGDGVCSLCVAARSASGPPAAEAAAERELARRVELLRERGRGRPYDCVVGVSGGRDSTYLLYLLVRKHGLRCLAAYYRTPFTSNESDANVRRLVDRLEVPLVEMNISRERHRRVARGFVALWARKPSAATANMTCAVCKLVNREIYRVATAHGVRAIVTGASRFEAVQISAGISRHADLSRSEAGRRLSAWSQLKRNVRLVRKGALLLGTSRSFWRHIPLGIQASLLYISPHTPYLRLRYRNVTALEYFYFAEWDEADCNTALREVGWELPPGCLSTWRSDCSFAEVKNAMFARMTGATYADSLMSNMVRYGAVSRDAALKRLRVEGRISPERLAHACRVLELPDAVTLQFEEKGR
jgi:3'-phosphoadenosine 5'-phosphosulfate sulfotransferase (PAPS reductase)/FAD synthetase